MATYVVRSKNTNKGTYLKDPDGYEYGRLRDAHRFTSLEEALVVVGRNPSWREVVRVTYRRKVRRIAVLKVVR